MPAHAFAAWRERDTLRTLGYGWHAYAHVRKCHGLAWHSNTVSRVLYKAVSHSSVRLEGKGEGLDVGWCDMVF